MHTETAAGSNTHKKTRIAPTPSGYLHIGNIYSFALTWLTAQHSGAKILLRIDDMDGNRTRKEYIDDIFRALDLAGITYDEGPSGTEDFLKHFSQHTRIRLYAAALEKLAEEKLIFACACSRSEILRQSSDGSYPGSCREKKMPLEDSGLSWRLHSAQCKSVLYRDLFLGDMTVHYPEVMRDPVVRRRDGLPSYQITSIVDDCHYGIDLIVRGADLTASTAAQCCIAESLNAQNFLHATFAHHMLVQSTIGKLSKSQNAPSVTSHYSSRSDLLTALGVMMGIEKTRIDSMSELNELTSKRLPALFNHRPAMQ